MSDRLLGFFDLDSWEEHIGKGSSSGLVCPYCDYEALNAPKGEGGVYTCACCMQQYRWQRIRTRLGLAWLTWQRAKAK